ncbi:ERBB receptor feedback inhibitor 1 [Trichosurus vulpecula]|uniref:ERBB receptor feedback inhibitor 1 n=1 Tax=Trichosurus vulpecula TaxID=9337 RepID=UPI00186AFFA2|nr:ERBB receptor feedback inhibitor 1 [Trichosurus vulpecula]
MSSAGVAAQEIRVPLKTGFLRNGQAMGSLKTCWGSRKGFENNFLNIDPITMAYNLNSTTQQHLTTFGHISKPVPVNGHCFAENCFRTPSQMKSALPPLILSPSEHFGKSEEDHVVCGVKKLSVNGVCAASRSPPLTPVKNGPSLFSSVTPGERGSRPLPPLPISEDFSRDDTDCEVEFITSSDTDFLLEDCSLSVFKYGVPGRRSFRGCGQINYAYFDTPAVEDGRPTSDQRENVQNSTPVLQQSHRKLRRSHSGPAGSFNKPASRLSSHLHRASPNSDEDKPEVPPRVPIPPRPVKPDYRRWSAEVTSSTYSDEDRPPKVPPREPLSRSNSRTPSPKSLPTYLNGVMPPTQSFAPDPKYVSSKALQRQNSEGSASKGPCILPIIENGKKVSSTHYYLLPERPPYLDKYEKFFRESEETSAASAPVQPPSSDCRTAAVTEKLDSKAKVDLEGQGKRKHLSYVVSP